MDRQQVERIAEKFGLTLRKTDGVEKSRWDAEWTLGQPPYESKLFFRTLQDAYNYCANAIVISQRDRQ